MSISLKSPAALIGQTTSGQTDLERLKAPAKGGIEAEKVRLRKATDEFQSFFMYQMLKTMRKTIPENPLTKNTPMSDGMGKDMFTDMFDMEIARKGKFGGKNSISDMLYRSLEKLIDAKYSDQSGSEDSADSIFVPLQPVTPGSHNLNQTEPFPLERETQPIELPARRPSAFQLEQSVRRTSENPLRTRFGRYIDEAAEETQLDSTLIESVIQTESNGNPKAVSSAGAKGLMQLMDSTATDLKVSDVHDPRENIRAGSRYLRQMIDRFGSLELGLAAYNAGPGNVEKYGGVPPFAETKDYVKRVTALAEQKSGDNSHSAAKAPSK